MFPSPRPGEVCTFTDAKTLKPAALLFDRVYLLGTFHERSLRYEVPPEIGFSLDENELAKKAPAEALFAKYVDEVEVSYDGITASKLLPDMVRIYASFYAQRGITLVPSYHCESAFDADFPSGNQIAYRAALANIPLVSNDVSWYQVVEFRNDQDSLRKYRALRTWMADALKGKSYQESVDIIGRRLDEYQWSLKKHGMQTIIGSLSQMLSFQGISGTAAGAWATGALSNSPVLAAVAGGLIVTGQVAASIAEKMLALEDLKRNSAEIAILHEAGKLAGQARQKHN